ncbi:hypothetical protein ACD578_07785 [Microvirga sp. RSM25]|uniref:hypothetical protein n=1 Tax=Microvirga sp. RSM25 TaxID=3273802 RepID=UPI00384B1CE1
MEKCFYIGQAYGENDRQTSGYIYDVIGNMVELHINAKYSDWKLSNGRVCVPHPLPLSTDFFDALDDTCFRLAEFLKSKDSFVDSDAAENWCKMRKARDGDKSLVPDIVSNDTSFNNGSIKEFYEIKSDSPSSRAAGRQKVANFNEMLAGLQIQYAEGDKYSPNGKTLVYSGTWACNPIKWYLRWSRVEGCIIGYKFCAEVSSATIQEAALVLALRMALLMLALSRSPAAAAATAGILAQIRSPLLQSVGENGVNSTNDVQYVQLLINDWRGRNGLNPIPVDGSPSDVLNSAIEEFSTAVMNSNIRRIDPNSPDIKMLEQVHFEAGLNDVSDEFQITALGAQLVDILDLIMRADEGISLDPEATIAAALQYYLDRMHDEQVRMF